MTNYQHNQILDKITALEAILKNLREDTNNLKAEKVEEFVQDFIAAEPHEAGTIPAPIAIVSECPCCKEILTEVSMELHRAFNMFPPFNSGHEGFAIIYEELQELWAEVQTKQSTAGRDERMRKEAIQIAAMAIRFINDLPSFQN